MDHVMSDMLMKSQTLSELAASSKALIWSGQWNMYWRDNGSGYCASAADAGVYDLADALKRVAGCGPEKHITVQPISDRQVDQLVHARALRDEYEQITQGVRTQLVALIESKKGKT